MMKRLLLLPLLCFPLWIFAQGFGSFSHDQPFLSSSAVSAIPPSCNGAEWNPGTNTYAYAVYDFNCLGQDAGTPITSVSDLGQNGLTISPMWTTNTPYCTNNVLEINNRRYGFFDGVNDNLQNSTSQTWPGAATIFLVSLAPQYNSAVGAVIFDDGSNSEQVNGMSQMFFLNSGGGYFRTGPNGGESQLGPFTQNTNWVVTEVVFNGASSYIKTNGTTALSGSQSTTTRRVGVTLGSNRGQTGAGNEQFALVKIAWAGFYTNADATMSSNIFYYLTNRFNIHN